MTKKLTREEFIRKAREVHGDKYDYSKVAYVNSRTQVCIICRVHGEFKQTPSDHLQGHGCNKCALISRTQKITGTPVKKREHLVYGVGINDSLDCVKVEQKHLPSYSVWMEMLARCYNEKRWIKQPTYKGCLVCEEWKRYSNFKLWYDNNHIDGYDLDKDILIKGNRIYSPETCCFVPSEINSMFVKNNANRGNLPIGVYVKYRGLKKVKYGVSLSLTGKRGYVGYYDTPEEAFAAYKRAKEAHIKEVAEKYYSDGKITKRVYDALMRYEVEITD